jgi:hypothetical protein
MFGPGPSCQDRVRVKTDLAVSRKDKFKEARRESDSRQFHYFFRNPGIYSDGCLFRAVPGARSH